jgi:hypothetical protein
VLALDGTQFQWLHELLVCFNDGDLHQYDELTSKYATVLNSQPALVQNERRLREKITIMSLLEMSVCGTVFDGNPPELRWDFGLEALQRAVPTYTNANAFAIAKKVRLRL